MLAQRPIGRDVQPCRGADPQMASASIHTTSTMRGMVNITRPPDGAGSIGTRKGEP
jgi:hypothetical protein